MMPFAKQEIISGLQLLYSLRLPGAPPEDGIEATANGWLFALENRTKGWDEQQDKGRINQAFILLAAEVTRWPPPALLIERLPPRAEVQKLTHNKTLTPEQKQAGQANLNRIQTIINQALARKKMK